MDTPNRILDKEHVELLELLGKAAAKKTEVGIIFSKVLHTFRFHLKKEEDTIVPLLNHLKYRLDGNKNEDFGKLTLAIQTFESSYAEMMQEHEKMGELIKTAQGLLKAKPDMLASELSAALLHHVELEEEFLYPAAFASGDLIELAREDRERAVKH